MATKVPVASLTDMRARLTRLAQTARFAFGTLQDQESAYAREILAVAEAHEEAAAVYQRHLDRAVAPGKE